MLHNTFKSMRLLYAYLYISIVFAFFNFTRFEISKNLYDIFDKIHKSNCFWFGHHYEKYNNKKNEYLKFSNQEININETH